MSETPAHSPEIWDLLSLLLDHHGDGAEAYLHAEWEQAEDAASRAGWAELRQALADIRRRRGETGS